jgi:hypothetical protein
MGDEFCGWTCPRKKGEPCDLCEARARKRRDDARQAAGLPTLTHRPFAEVTSPPHHSRRERAR